MKHVKGIGHIIAERSYVRVDARGRHRTVAVRIGQPREHADAGPWMCPFVITGLGQRMTSSAQGRDAVQALLRGLAQVRFELVRRAQETNSVIVWKSLDGSLGLPGDPPPMPVQVRMGQRARWPGRPRQPRPRIPAKAQEKVTRLDEAGRKSTSEFWLDGQRVGRVEWSPSGVPLLATGLHQGAPDGHFIEYHEDGTVSYAEPYVDGLPHGWAKQYDSRGRLLLVSPFRRGTGIDFWCDDEGRLAEEHPLLGGKPSGRERWWSTDQKSVYSEGDWLDGLRHGIWREWTDGTLARGSPAFFIRGEQVSKRRYLASARADPTLPEYRKEEDLPRRTLPEQFLHLRQRAHRVARVRRP